MSVDTNNPSRSLTIGLAFVTGLGLIFMIIALGIGVVGGGEADSAAIGLLFAAGIALFILGLGGWLAAVQPHKQFDDINVPQYTGHHEDDAH